MIRRPPRSTLDRSSAASDVYKRQGEERIEGGEFFKNTVASEQFPYAALLVGAVFQVCNVVEAMHENGKGEGVNC